MRNNLHASHLVIGSHIQSDGQTLVGLDACQGGIESQLAHRDAHTACTQIAKAQNPLAVRHHDRPHVGFRPRNAMQTNTLLLAESQAPQPSSHNIARSSSFGGKTSHFKERFFSVLVTYCGVR